MCVLFSLFIHWMKLYMCYMRSNWLKSTIAALLVFAGRHNTILRISPCYLTFFGFELTFTCWNENNSKMCWPELSWFLLLIMFASNSTIKILEFIHGYSNTKTANCLYFIDTRSGINLNLSKHWTSSVACHQPHLADCLNHFSHQFAIINFIVYHHS